MMRESVRWTSGLCGASLLGLLSGVTPLSAEAPPTRYMVSEVFSLIAPGQILKIARDGDRATLEQFIPPGVVSPPGSHSRAYYNLAAGASYTLDLLDPSMACGPSHFSGDWGDPFVQSAGLAEQLAALHPVDRGPAIVNGIATRLHEAKSPDGLMDLWIEPRTGLIVKWVATPPSGPPKIMIEVTALSQAPPPAESLALPAKCQP